MSKRIFCILLSSLLLAGAVSCGKKKESSLEEIPTAPTEVVTEAPTESVTEPIVSENINPLTGESDYNSDAVGKRPVAIMVNNLKAALPQYGVNDADIIYELPVEGGITRLMAVYADYQNVPNVCSVRSCRYYYPIIALGLDAIYCHWGADQTIALETLNRTGIDHLDGASEEGLFYRDQDRVGKYDSEHTGYLCGAELPQHFESHNFRTDVNTENKGAGLSFVSEGENNMPSDASDCTSVTLNFSDTYYSTFDYDSAAGTYYKKHSGNPHMDGVTGNQLEFENVFVIQTGIRSRNGYLMDVDLVGNGSGYYISKGKVQNITWSKGSETSPIRLYGSDGNELKLNVGESYFGIIGTDKNISFS